ncbi:MAG: SDR family NAD(P)-dependent oxidoreductase [Spirochaetota bacterium]
MKLKDKISVITGASSKRGIGCAIAKEFAKEGALVVATDRIDVSEVVGEIRSSGGRALGLSMDVTKSEQIKAMVEKVYREYGRIDGLVNNAGICPFVPFLDLTEDIWDVTIDVNLKGVFLCSHAVTQAMVKNNQNGKIINIASMCIERPSLHQTPYAASKGGVYMLTRNMALELAPYRINVNAIAPASIETDIARRGEEILQQLGYYKDKDVRAGHENQTGLKQNNVPPKNGQQLQPYDVARAAVFLASDDANNITGETIRITGFHEIR